MSKREKVLELLESTSGCDKSLEKIIREEWNIELMKDSLDLLKEIYQRLKEKYENPPSDGSYDLDMIKLLSDKLTAIGYWRWKLDDPITQQFLPELREDIVRTIEVYYRFIAKSIEEGGGNSMMVIKVEKKGKLVKSWSFDKVDSVTEKSVIEALDDVYTTINRFRKERGTAEVEM